MALGELMFDELCMSSFLTVLVLTLVAESIDDLCGGRFLFPIVHSERSFTCVVISHFVGLGGSWKVFWSADVLMAI